MVEKAVWLKTVQDPELMAKFKLASQRVYLKVDPDCDYITGYVLFRLPPLARTRIRGNSRGAKPDAADAPSFRSPPRASTMPRPSIKCPSTARLG